jgi:hypothetical protein
MSVELEGKVVVPGDKLGPADGFKCGSGCYTAGPYVYASVVGVVSLNQDTASAPQEGGDEEMVDSQPRVNVVRRKDRFAPVVPNTDNIVIAKVNLKKRRPPLPLDHHHHHHHHHRKIDEVSLPGWLDEAHTHAQACLPMVSTARPVPGRACK